MLSSEDLLVQCQDFINSFYTTASEIVLTGFGDMASESFTCSGTSICEDGEEDAESCTWQRKFAVSCFLENDVTKIRIQTNSLPNHCIQTSTTFPTENLIDFEVDFNSPKSDLSLIQLNTQIKVDAVLCSKTWTDETDLEANQNFVLHSGDTYGVVGIALNGVPIYQGISADNMDAFFPVTSDDFTVERVAID